LNCFSEQLQDQICQVGDDSDSNHITYDKLETNKAAKKGNSSGAADGDADGDNKDDDDDNNYHDQVGDNNKGPRLAKRR
jgi:hypothetical protein